MTRFILISKVGQWLSAFGVQTAITAGIAWLISFFVPLVPFLIMVCLLVLTDLYTGVRASRFRGEKIRSRRMRDTFHKINLYFIAIILSEAMKTVFLPFAPITFMTSIVIALVEFKSNLENIAEVTGVDIWKNIASYLPSWKKKAQKDIEEEDSRETIEKPKNND